MFGCEHRKTNACHQPQIRPMAHDCRCRHDPCRLWALSLAHQQLSVVFFSMTILSGMAAPFPLNMILIYFWFGVWFAITVGILLGMDVLECFLHVLRLHWVEFQSKFFRADGYAFEPYCHKALLEKSGEDGALRSTACSGGRRRVLQPTLYRARGGLSMIAFGGMIYSASEPPGRLPASMCSAGFDCRARGGMSSGRGQASA